MSMTESEAIKRCDMLIHGLSVNNAINEAFNDENKGYVTFEAMSIFAETCKDALEEVEQYRAIGTVEEFKAVKQWKSDIIKSFNRYDVDSVDDLVKRFLELTEKAEPKKPNKQGNKLLVAEGWEYACPSCGCGIGVNERNEEYTQEDEYCPTCGQRLDWQ